ncbi:MAG: MFS transporter, partial [Bacteroidota bacterium]|nr:MFS transporter [Bacteroidota bacterium]
MKPGDEEAARDRSGLRDVAAGEPHGGDAEKTARAALWTSSIASFTTPFMSSGISVALPDIAREFHMSAVTLGWVAGAYLLAAAIFLLPFGRLADIHGRKRFFSAGLVVHSLACLFLAFSSGTPFLLVMRVVQGIGGGMIFGTSVAILVSATPPRRRGRVLGINAAAVYLGLTLGPALGGFLTHAFGWRSIFLLTAIVGLATAGAVWRLLEREWAEARGERFDAWGAVVYSLALTGVMLGFSFLPHPEGVALIVAGAAAFAIFLALESHTAHALLPMAMFRSNRVFTFS